MLLSAILHAWVGVLLKQSCDKLIFRSVLSISYGLIVLPFAFFLPLPTIEGWQFLFLGACIHLIYQLTQVGAFEKGDMSLVYPIMRGIAPALTAIVAFFFLNESLTWVEIAGLAIVVFALLCFAWPADGRSSLESKAIGLAAICGTMIACYSVVDAAGMRASENAIGQVWTYIVWFFIFDSLALPIYARVRHPQRLKTFFKSELPMGSVAGFLSLLSFGLALYAFTLAPVAKMSAMRETSVLFGAIFAALILKEKFGRRRVVLAFIMVIGLMILQK